MKYDYIIGVDLSISSPGVCIYDTKTEFKLENLKFHFFSSVKKVLKEFENHPQYHCIAMTEKTSYAKYDFITTTLIDIINQYPNSIIFLEGYSMGSRAGMILNIAENGGIFRYNMFKLGIPFEIPAPSQIKKFFHGKGNADKNMMFAKFLEETEFDLEEFLTHQKKKNIGSPVNDIVDAYALVKYGISVVALS